jgi:hypothetical protein
VTWLPVVPASLMCPCWPPSCSASAGSYLGMCRWGLYNGGVGGGGPACGACQLLLGLISAPLMRCQHIVLRHIYAQTRP